MVGLAAWLFLLPLEQLAEIELGRDVGDQVQELELLAPPLLHALDVLAVHQRHGGLRRHGLEQSEVVCGEVAVPPVEDLGDPDDRAPGRSHR